MEKATPKTVTADAVKIAVIMDVPNGPLLCCLLEDLALKPARGSSYLYRGQVYEVERTLEMLETASQTTDQQLLALLNALYGKDHSTARVASMRNLGEEHTASGIILPASLNLTRDASRLVYLKLRQVQTASPAEGMIQLARQAMENAGKPHALVATGADEDGAADIVSDTALGSNEASDGTGEGTAVVTPATAAASTETT